MYSALNTDLMFQEMHDRAERMKHSEGKDPGGWPNRKWWHKGASRAE